MQQARGGKNSRSRQSQDFTEYINIGPLRRRENVRIGAPIARWKRVRTLTCS